MTMPYEILARALGRLTMRGGFNYLISQRMAPFDLKICIYSVEWAGI